MNDFDMTPAPPAAAELPPPEDGHESLVRIGAELTALDAAHLARINIDIPRACALAIGALPAIRAMRPQVVEHLPRFPVEALDKLRDYAYALYYAHMMCSPPKPNGQAVRALFAEATSLRTLMLAQAEALAMKGLFDRAKVDEIRGGSGYVDAANDVIALSLMYRQAWSTVKDKTCVGEAECLRADVSGRELLTAMGTRMQREEDGTKAETQLRRARCFTLFVRAYDRCRQAASHLRWDHGVAPRIVPPLSQRTRRRPRRDAGAEAGGPP